jgi:pimeloyl-ACP methyl ester carboxylesterase
LIYGEDDGQVPIETADRYVLALQQAGHPDVSYQRLAGVDHCPHSIQKIPSADAFFHEFLKRILVDKQPSPPKN